MSDKPQHTGKTPAQIKKALLEHYRRAPRMVAQMALKHFEDNFQLQGFMDETLDPWDGRKKDDGSGRAILTGKGSATLRRSIRVIEATPERIVIGTDLPYAQVHNDGGEFTVRAHTRTSKKGNVYQVKAYTMRMPQRKFIGNSKALERKIDDYMRQEIDKIDKP